MKKIKSNKKLIIICAVCAAVIAVGVIIAFALKGSFGKPAGETTAVDTAYKSEPIADDFEAVALGGGIKLVGLAEVSAKYPEDGKDEFCENVLSATILNESSQMLQYAVVELTIGGQVYTFDISSIPAGEKVIAFEKNKKAAPEKIEGVTCEAKNVVFFDETPTKLDDVLKVTFFDGMLSIENISDTDLAGKIIICYKNKLDDAYFGGITYRIQISDLEAGEKIKGASTHADAEDSVLMFVQYVQ